jgi:hypothetical protein
MSHLKKATKKRDLTRKISQKAYCGPITGDPSEGVGLLTAEEGLV